MLAPMSAMVSRCPAHAPPGDQAKMGTYSGVIRTGMNRVAAVVSRQDEQIIGSHARQDVRQALVEGLRALA